ncbi:hypothetical protein D0T49_01185 [Paludibacter sp. 221]|uniref:hypothetical protein n=1 Tax=Paludibacter sp. 221 TaxID=2302939 RepID=UPI0013D59D0D|nr:hypothetical protein [Paludibacter sp. 221]NDV45664.1 hypothetical protein [Paludibacter sp. 221]
MNLLNNSVSNPQTIDENEFTYRLAHELLHNWWKYFKKYESLKWKIIRDKQNSFGYYLGDGKDGKSNNNCSEGESHERNNPEHTKVCNNENKY